MKDQEKEVVNELIALRQRVAELEAQEAKHRRIEKRLLETASELQVIFQAFPDLYIRMAADGTILDYNTGDLIGLHTHLEMLLNPHPDTQAVERKFREAVSQALQTHALVNIEYSLTPPLEQPRMFEARLLPLSNEQVIVIIRDITERKRAENQLHRRDAVLEAVSFAAERFLQAIEWQEGIEKVLARLGQALDVGRVYLFERRLNPSDEPAIIQRHQWLTSRSASGQSSDTICTITQLFELFPQWPAMLRRGEPIGCPVKMCSAEEQAALADYHLRSILIMPILVGERWWGGIGFEEYVLDREWLPAELDALKAAADIMGAAVLRQQTEGALREAYKERDFQKQIQQQERLAAVGQLAAGIAHDFNNILTSIIGFSELARIHPRTPPEVAHDLERITYQGQRAAKLVRQILDFSRQSVTARRPIDLMPFFKESIKLLERTIPENIRITVEIEPGEYLLNADLSQIQQAITNLAVNARDAMPGGGLLQFRLSRLTLEESPPSVAMGPGEWVVIAVADTGTGISAEALPHIYDPFFTTKEVGSGAGLGLAQVYGIVMQHDGHIDVTTMLNQGTTFTLYLPALPATKEPASTQMHVNLFHGNGEAILLVEDDPSVLEVEQALLTSLGYQVFTATNGLKALELYQQHQVKFDLVLTDLTMPQMGGVALARALRQQDPTLKVVALSGYSLEAEANNLRAQGLAGWLQKPLSVEQLAYRIWQALHWPDA